jgi:hypothetical protein
LVGDRLVVDLAKTERVAVERDALREVGDDDSDVIDRPSVEVLAQATTSVAA